MTVYDVFLKTYKRYTPIQEIALPIIGSGKNCIISAPTGSGKTEAALLPVLDSIVRSGKRDGVVALYITPLRALNRDMIKRVEGLCNAIGVSVAVRHGDTLQSERSRQSRKAPVLLITTPETLQSILPTKYIGRALANVRHVIVDEIHELYHTKRGAQLALGLERLEEAAPNFQRIGISATISDMAKVKTLLCGARDCKHASIDSRRDLELKVVMPRSASKGMGDIAERFGLDAQALARLDIISKLIAESKSTLVFANTRQIVEALGSRLLYLNGIRPFGGIGVHHSSLDKEERIRIEEQFKSGALKSIIATSSLELGIDIGAIDLVVQYGSPRQALRLIQRAGRSGHSVSRKAHGTIIATNEVDAIEAITICRNVGKGMLEGFSQHELPLDVLANQVCGIALDKGICSIDDVLSIVRRAGPFVMMKKDALEMLLKFMTDQRMIGFDGKSVSSGGRTRMYYYGHLSVIPDSKRYVVKNIANNRIVSSLDERFVASNVEEGSVFITKGLPWKVVSIDNEIIHVEPSDDLEAAVPDWSGEDIPVSEGVALGFFDTLNELHEGRLPKDWRGSEELFSELKAFVKAQGDALPSRDSVMIEEHDSYAVVLTGLGTLANEALSRLLGHILSMRLGRSVNIKASPYMVFVEAHNDVGLTSLLHSVSPGSVESELRDAVAGTELFRYRFVTVAKLFGMIDRDATVSKSVAKRLVKVLAGTPVYSETERELMHNYFDVESLRDFFAKLHDGRLKVRSVHAEQMTPLTKTILDSAYYTKELLMPLTPSTELLDSFVKYMLAKRVKLLCTYCGMTFSRDLAELEPMGEILCPACGSPMVVPFQEDYKKLVDKRLGGGRLSLGERAMLKDIMQQASLMRSYGGKAAVALATYGIGPRTAARALLMLRRDERLFYLDLIEAQKQFIKNKKYWSVT